VTICDEAKKRFVKKKRKKRAFKGKSAKLRIRTPRTRSRTDQSYDEVSYVKRLSPTDYAPASQSHWSNNSYEYMVDVTGNMQGWNPTFHQKLQGNVNPLVTFHDPAEGYDMISFTSDHSPSVLSKVETNSLLQMPPSICVSFNRLANHSVVTAMPCKVLALNFIFELLEMLGKMVVKLTRFKKRGIWNNILRTYKVSYEGAIAAGHDEAASRWIAWNFAVKPFAKDLIEILCSYVKTMKRLAYLRKVNHRITVERYSAPDLCAQYDPVGTMSDDQRTVFVDEVYSTQYSDPAKGLMATYITRVYIKLESFDGLLGYQAAVRYNLPDWLLETETGRILGNLDTTGFSNPFAVLWEAGHFSWLLDWFTNRFSEVFKYRGSFSLFNDATILGSTWSYKMHARFGVYQRNEYVKDYDDFTHFESFEDIKLGDVSYDFYHRSYGTVPEDIDPLLQVDLSAYQLSILLALIQQGWRRRR